MIEKCPVCGSKDTDMDHLSYIPDTDPQETSDDFRCRTCGSRWENIFVYKKTYVHKWDEDTMDYIDL